MTDPALLASVTGESQGLVETLANDVDGSAEKKVIETLSRQCDQFSSQLNAFQGSKDQSDDLLAIVAAYNAAISLVPKVAEKLNEQQQT